MADKTAIEWTDATWNPIGGCSIKSPGCAPCYAQSLAGTRLKNHPLYAGTTDNVKGKHVFNGHLTVAPDDHPVWAWPERWRGAKNPKLGPGKPSLIFVGDMSDLFHENRPRKHIDRTVDCICRSNHIGQLLTKRPNVMEEYFEEKISSHNQLDFPSQLLTSRLWLGTSAERQRELDERMPHLLRLARLGFIVFISYEPAIGPIVLPPEFLALGRRAQVISGGMSGPEGIPAPRIWFRSVRNQCAASGVAYFHKQNGEFIDADEWLDMVLRFPAEISYGGNPWRPSRPLNYCDSVILADIGNFRFEHYTDGTTMLRVGKKRAGRLLDGVEHSEFPFT
jgi:protein gp37